MRSIYILPILLISNFAMGAECHLPSGEVKYSDSSYTPPSVSDEYIAKARVQASSDCSSVRVWTYVTGKSSSKVEPTSEQCKTAKTTYPFSNPPGLLSCADFKVYPSEQAAEGQAFPHAFVKNGALVLREFLYGTPTPLSGVYLQSENSNVVTELTHTAARDKNEDFPGGSYPGKVNNSYMAHTNNGSSERAPTSVEPEQKPKKTDSSTGLWNSNSY